MTNEEAIEILKRVEIAKPIKFEDYADMSEALDMAIKSLEQTETWNATTKDRQIIAPKGTFRKIWEDEQQPCEDAISREEALKVMCDKCPMYNCVTGCSSYRHIEKMPSVTPQQTRWIPCSERLPEDNIHVLCQFTLSGMGECYLAHGVFHVVGGVVMTCNEVVAWMPLPQPYKAESEEEG